MSILYTSIYRSPSSRRYVEFVGRYLLVLVYRSILYVNTYYNIMIQQSVTDSSWGDLRLLGEINYGGNIASAHSGGGKKGNIFSQNKITGRVIVPSGPINFFFCSHMIELDQKV